ncbi:DNA mismatch repair endonuclease MutL [Clostridia bacterium]|nr:DNA mismatch repair endonuclease MutL [Clostridia bacterium]
MGKIYILGEEIANQIAAGEVVEKPASVVKELVENAMDAGAQSIRVEIEEGGLSKIEVEDDGIGMEKEDISLAFKRHATSKIRQAQDLFELTTMGFRGEALPSIASVSKICLCSQVQGEAKGNCIELHGGKSIKTKPIAMSHGTCITVSDLFFNTPARKKFMKSPHLEKGAIVDLVQKLAMSHTDIAFTLVSDGKTLFKTRGSGDLRDTLAYLIPGELSRKLIEVKEDSDYFSVRGLIAPSYLYRATRDMEIFFVNGRYVRSKVLQNALEEAYRHRIPIRKYPIGILSINMNPAALDVNIHPSKMEVKFSMEQALKKELSLCVQKTLTHESEIRGLGQNSSLIQANEEIMPTTTDLNELAKKDFSKEPAKEFRLVPEKPKVQEEMVFEKALPNPYVRVANSGTQSIDLPLHDEFLGMRVLSVIAKTYVVLTKNDQLYLLDQHAAHERVRYESLKKAYCAEKLTAQFLLEPVVLILGYDQKERMLEQINRLSDLGVVVELFGEDEFLLRGVPAGLKGMDYQLLFEELLDALENDQESIKERMLEMASCRGAIKAGDSIRLDEVSVLLKEMSKLEDPYTCPHGRPTVIKLGKEELAKLFLRD